MNARKLSRKSTILFLLVIPSIIVMVNPIISTVYASPIQTASLNWGAIGNSRNPGNGRGTLLVPNTHIYQPYQRVLQIDHLPRVTTGDQMIKNSEMISEPSYPAAIDTTVSQKRSWIGRWSTDPLVQPELFPNDTLVLKTGEAADNWLIRGSGNSSTTNIYLPIVSKAAALPSIPLLYDIDNADGDGAYSVNWSVSNHATGYTLEEDDTSEFPSPTVIYSGPGTTKAITGYTLGNYFYRVRAENGMGLSDWSEVKMASVTKGSDLICETHQFGTVAVAWPIYPSGRTEIFGAENNMLVETIEVKSVLKALLPVYIHAYVSINGEQIADKNHYVFSNVYTPYYINEKVARELHVGDEIKYFITKAVGDTEAWIAWGNYVRLCGR